MLVSSYFMKYWAMSLIVPIDGLQYFWLHQPAAQLIELSKDLDEGITADSQSFDVSPFV